MQSVSGYVQLKISLPNLLNVFYQPFDRFVRWIKDYRRDVRLLAIAKEYHKCLTELEMTPISKCDISAELVKVKFLTQEMQASPCKSVKKAIALLNRQVVAQEYRLGNGMLLSDDEVTFQQVAALAQEWKSSKAYFINKSLSQGDVEKLRLACQYADFVKLLMTDPICQDEFFKWTIINDSTVNPFQPNDVSVFIKFPGLHQEILGKLGYRSARFGGDLFQVDAKDQVLTVPIEGTRVKVIIDAPKMVLKGHEGLGKRTVSFQNIFNELNKRISHVGEGDFDIIDKEGIWLWNAKKLAVYNEDLKKYIPINLEGDGWINRLRTDETISYEEAEKRYRVKMEVKPDGFEGDLTACEYPNLPPDTHPLFVMHATQPEDYQFTSTHLFNAFLLVNRKTKTVEIKTIGQYMYPFPKGAWQNLVQLTRFSPSNIYNPDEAIHRGNRQHAGDYETPPVVVRTNPEEFVQYLRSVKTDILNGWKGKLGFNFVVAQCTVTMWCKARTHFGVGRIPDLRVRFWEMKPKDAVRKLYMMLKPLPERIQKFVLFLLGSWRSMHVINKYGEEVSTSLYSYPRPFKWIVHPAALFKPIDPKLAVH